MAANPYRVLLHSPAVRWQALTGLLAQTTQGAGGIGIILVIREHHGSLALAGAVVGVLSVAAGVARPVQGRLIDRRGARGLMVMCGDRASGGTGRDRGAGRWPRPRSRADRHRGARRGHAAAGVDLHARRLGRGHVRRRQHLGLQPRLPHPGAVDPRRAATAGSRHQRHERVGGAGDRRRRRLRGNARFRRVTPAGAAAGIGGAARARRGGAARPRHARSHPDGGPRGRRHRRRAGGRADVRHRPSRAGGQRPADRRAVDRRHRRSGDLRRPTLAAGADPAAADAAGRAQRRDGHHDPRSRADRARRGPGRRRPGPESEPDDDLAARRLARLAGERGRGLRVAVDRGSPPGPARPMPSPARSPIRGIRVRPSSWPRWPPWRRRCS